MGIQNRVILLCFIVLIPAYSALNLSNITKTDRIDITYNTKGEILHTDIIKKSDIKYYTPKKNHINFNKPFKKLKTKFGIMYLFDFGKDNLYLNALEYDTITLDINLSNVLQLGIADKKYFQKEDHLKLPLQHEFKLKNMFKKIDLSQLKYMIVTTTSQTSPLKSIEFKKSGTKYSTKKSSIGLWAWHPKNIRPSLFKTHNITYSYIQIRDGFLGALQRLSHDNPGKIYGLNGSPNDIFHFHHLINDIHMLASLQKRYPFIHGYQVDIEPYLLHNFKKNKEVFLKKYLLLLHNLKNKVHRYGLKFSVTIPFWFDHLYLHDTNVGFSVIEIADEVVVMSYRSDIRKAVSLSSNLLNYAKFTHKQIRIGLECMKIEDENHTLYTIKQDSDPCLIDKTLIKQCTKLKKLYTYTVFGKDISFWNQTEKLSGLKDYTVPYSAFSGFVLHHYDVLPLHLF